MGFAQVDVGDGVRVTFETKEDTPIDGLMVNGLGDVGAQKLDELASAAGTISKKFRDAIKPNEISVEFTVGWSGTVGWFVAKSTLEAAISVSATWTSADPEPPTS